MLGLAAMPLIMDMASLASLGTWAQPTWLLKDTAPSTREATIRQTSEEHMLAGRIRILLRTPTLPSGRR